MARAIARGKIRVDARRALSKLREHMLADPYSYLSELCRGGVASGATALRVVTDADDVILSWAGGTPPVGRVLRLFDYLLSDVASAEERRMRLLAIGVNAALGLDPRFVDVTLPEPGGHVRVRFSAAQLSGSPDAPPPPPQVTRVPPPRGAFDDGAVIQVRKRVGLGVVSRALFGGAHPEVRALAERIGDLPIPCEMEHAVPAPPRTLVRAAVSMAGVRCAYVELLPAGNAPVQDVSEQGVQLIRSTWRPLELEPDTLIGLPARLYVDAEALPTNASRSVLREDSAFVHELADAGATALFAALSAAAFEVTGRGEVADGVEVLERGEILEDALGAVVCTLASAARRGRSLEPRLEKLLELELLEDATGRRRSVLEFLTAPRAFVLRGADPVPPELAMWMGDVLRLRGRVVESALAGVELADGEAILERAKMGAQRWQRWLGHETSGPVVPESDDELFREAIADECGLTGHVAVRDPETAPLASVVRVFLQERPLEHLRLDRSQLPLPVDAAFAWDDRLRPTFDFDGVERSDDLTEATVNVILVALRGVEHRARELAADERGRRVLCAALSTLARLPQSFGTEVSSADFPELWRARVWSGTDPGRRLSLDQLARWAAKRQALCFVVESSAAQGAAPDGRPVLKVAEAELDDICRLLGGDIERVPYERAFAVTKDERRAAVREVFRHELEELKLSGAPTVTLEQDHFVALIAPSPVNRMVEMHAGVVLARLPKHGGLGSSLRVVDDMESVPREGWDGIRHSPTRFWWLEAESALCEELMTAAGRGSLAPVARVFLLSAAAELASRVESAERRGRKGRWEQQTAELHQRLWELPFVERVGANGKPERVSLGEISSRGPIYFLAAAPGFETDGARPVLLSTAEEREALRRVFPNAVDGEPMLADWRQRALAAERRRAFLARATLAPDRPGPAADPDSPVVQVQRSGAGSGAVALAKSVAVEDPVEVTHQGRLVVRVRAVDLKIPVAARVELPEERHFEMLSSLTEGGIEAFWRVLEKGARALALVLMKRGDWMEDARSVALVAALSRRDPQGEVAAAARESLPGFPTIRGERAPIAALARQNLEIWLSHTMVASWPSTSRDSDLDRPVLALPMEHSSAWQELLVALGYSLRDVSDAVAKLLSLRTSEERPPATLPGAPAHPLLRRTLAELGVRVVEGEAEIVEGPESEVTLMTLDGGLRSIPAELVLPMRLMLRWDRLDSSRDAQKTVLKAVVRAAYQYLASISDRLDELPGWVRHHLRGHLLHRQKRGKRLGEAERKWPVFVDIRGAWHSMDDLGDGPWRFTSLGPPYPARKYRYPIVVLRADEVPLLSSRESRDVHTMLVGDLRGEERAHAAPRETVALSAEQRARCMGVTSFSDGTTQGEVGLVHPSAFDGETGVELLTGRRPLCRLTSSLGWPIVAVVDDSSVSPNRWFSKPRRKKDGEVVLARVETAARRLLRELLPASGDVLVSTWLDGEATPGGLRLTGRVWLPKEWPRTPRVDLAVPGMAHLLQGGLSVRQGVVPVAGSLLVAPASGGSGALALNLTQVTGSLLLPAVVMDDLGAAVLAQAMKLTESAKVPMEYLWDLALLGADVAPETTTVDGQPFDAARLRAELLAEGVWLTRHAGSAEGAFPERFSGKILAYDDPLANVLRARAPDKVHELGGAAAPRANPLPAAMLPRRVKTADKRVGLSDRVLAELSRLALAGAPAKSVELGSGRRPVTYREGHVALDPARLAGLVPRAEREPSALTLLVAAAVSEINRELGPVTDEEERRALLELLASL